MCDWETVSFLFVQITIKYVLCIKEKGMAKIAEHKRWQLSRAVHATFWLHRYLQDLRSLSWIIRFFAERWDPIVVFHMRSEHFKIRCVQFVLFPLRIVNSNHAIKEWMERKNSSIDRTHLLSTGNFWFDVGNKQISWDQGQCSTVIWKSILTSDSACAFINNPSRFDRQ